MSIRVRNSRRPALSTKAGADRTSGFSLIELLALIAVIAILAAALLPSLSHAKNKTWQAQCLNNTRQLTLGWTLYAANNLDQVASVDDSGVTNFADWGKYWAAGNMQDRPVCTNGNVLRKGLLFPYSPNERIYRCPADRSLQNFPAMTGGPRVRSLSCSQAFGRGAWLPASNYLTYAKTTHVRKPADTWVFIDEESHSINDGGFALKITSNSDTQGYLIDIPAGSHGGACGISFSDGHALFHEWQSRLTYTWPWKQLGDSQQVFTSTDADFVRDMRWFSSVTTSPGT